MYRMFWPDVTRLADGLPGGVTGAAHVAHPS
jgi:hypothetical protein